MRTLLLITAVLAMITLAVGGVSAHDGGQDTDRMNEMMNQCMEMAGQMGEVMGSEPMNEQERSETEDTADHHNGEMSSEEPTHTGMMGC